MNVLRRHLRRLAWLACSAMLALALVPTLAQAWQASGGRAALALAEVCSVHAADRADGGPPPPGRADGAAAYAFADHCPLCMQPAGAGAPPPVLPAWQPLAVVQSRPGAVAATPLPGRAWHAAAPRGPPLRT